MLHQLVKGTFKDHLVESIDKYITLHHPSRTAKNIMDVINQRYYY